MKGLGHLCRDVLRHPLDVRGRYPEEPRPLPDVEKPLNRPLAEKMGLFIALVTPSAIRGRTDCVIGAAFFALVRTAAAS
jgi:hypothetical protein